jgi:hypothetical protein
MKMHPHPLFHPEFLCKPSPTYYDSGNGLGIALMRDGVCAWPFLSLPEGRRVEKMWM